MEHTLDRNKIDVMLLDYRLGESLGDDISCKIRDLQGKDNHEKCLRFLEGKGDEGLHRRYDGKACEPEGADR